MLNKIRSVAKGPIALGTIRTSFVFGGRLIIQAGTLLLVAKMLGPEDFGAFAGIASLALIVGMLSAFGTNFVLLDSVSKHPNNRHEILTYAIPTVLLLGTLLLAPYLLFSYCIFHGEGTAFSVLIAIGFAEILLQPLLSLMVAEHHALGRVARSQALNILPLALRFTSVSIVILCQVEHELYWYAWGYFGASVIALLVGSLTLPLLWPALSKWRLARMVELKHAAGFAVMNVAAVGPSELDKTLAAKLLPLGGAGIYAVAVRVVGSITLPVIAMVLSAQPRLFREGSDVARSRKLLCWMFVATVIYSILLACILWLAAPVFGVLFGAEFEGVEKTLQLLCWVVPGMALRLAAGNILVALGNPWGRSIIEFAGMVVVTVFALLLVPYSGVEGMVVSLAIAEWAMAMAGIGSVIKLLHKVSVI